MGRGEGSSESLGVERAGAAAGAPDYEQLYRELDVMARRAIDAWLLHADDLDGAMDDLRDYVKNKPEAVELAKQLLAAEGD